jgi:hypothetical protein
MASNAAAIAGSRTSSAARTFESIAAASTSPAATARIDAGWLPVATRARNSETSGMQPKPLSE